jgi:hypothetical protein
MRVGRLTAMRVRLLAAAVSLVALPVGSACGDADADGACEGQSFDCGEALSARWAPDALPGAPLVRLCVEGVCNTAIEPYLNTDSGELHAPPWNEPLRDGEVSVALEVVDADGRTIESLPATVEAVDRCGCRSVWVTVEDGSLVQQE